MKRTRQTKAGKRNNRHPKSKSNCGNQQQLNNCQITITNERFYNRNDSCQENDVANVPTSPRPTTLSSRWTYSSSTEYKRCSGSECEDFNTPSLEYDMINEITVANDNYDDLPIDYDKEWDNIGFFNDETALCNGHGKYDMSTEIESDGCGQSFSDKVTVVNNSINKNSTNGIVDDYEKINNIKMAIEFTQNSVFDDGTSLDERNTQFEKSEMNNSTNENEGDHDKINQIKMAIQDSENNVFGAKTSLNDKNSKFQDSEVENLTNVIVDDYKKINESIDDFYEVKNENDYTHNRKDVFEDSFNDKILTIKNSDMKYPTNEIVDDYDKINEIKIEINCTQNSKFNDGDFFDCSPNYAKSDIEQNKASYEELFNLICTDENLCDETLQVKYFTLDISHERSDSIKYMSLPNKSMVDSFIKSATSITNVTSFSGSDSILNVDNENKSTNKTKTSKIKKCKNFLKKFKIAKRATKKEKDCEDNEAFSASVTDKPVLETNNTDKKTTEKETKNKKNIFKRLFRKKQKNKKETDQKIEANVEKKIENKCSVRKVEIESQIIDDFNKTLRSLIKSEDDKKCLETVKTNQHEHMELSVTSATSIVPYKACESVDHMFPDSVTASKMISPTCSDVPFMDDKYVAQLDFVSFYNGESRRIHINPIYLLPMASTETLPSLDFSFMDDPIVIKIDNRIINHGESWKCEVNTEFSVPIACVESFHASDERFKSNNRKSTPPTSNLSSSKRNSLFNSHSYRSESTTNTSPKTEFMINPCSNNANYIGDDPYQDFDETNQDIYDANQDIDVITEENASISEMIISYCIDPIESSINLISTPPLQRKIVKQPLKKCHSFNDIDFRRIMTINKKSESVQTFTSTDATLSVEIVRSDNTQGNYKSAIKLSLNHRLISKELNKNKIVINDKLKNLVYKFKRLHKGRFNYLLFNENSINKMDFFNSLILFKRSYYFQMLNDKMLKKIHFNYFKSNSHSDEIDNHLYTRMRIDELSFNGHKYQRDDDIISLKVNDFHINNKTWKNRGCFHGDEKSEISELSKVEEQTVDNTQSSSTSTSEKPSMLRSFITNPIVLSTLAIGGILLLIPTYNKLSHWLSSAPNLSLLPSIEPPAPEIIPPSSTLPVYHIPNSTFGNSFMGNLRYSII